MTKKISVALATYNGENFILKQLESLLHQSLKIDEVIIYDDNSKDNTTNIVKKFIEDNHLDWKLYCNEENVGYKKNFYNALKKTTGDYVFLCDQDDIWHNDKVKELMNIFVNNSNVKCVNTAFECINENDEHIQSFSFIKKELKENKLYQVPFKDIIIQNIAMGCTMAFTKEIKELYLKHSKCIAAHDWEINAISSIYDGLYFYNKPLIQYRIHTHNTTGIDTMNNSDRINNRIKNSIEIQQFLASLYLYEQYMDDIQKNYLYRVSMFSNKRVDMLKNRQIKQWLYLIKNIDLYKQYVSKKGMLIELYLSLK